MLIFLPQAEPGSGPLSGGVFGSHLPTQAPPSAPPTGGARPKTTQAAAGQAWEGGGTANGYGCRWLTCLLTLGDGRLSKVFDFPVLLQKPLQKVGGFRNSNSKASSQPFLPYMNRNAKLRGSPDSHPWGQRARATRQGPWPCSEPAEGLWEDWVGQGPAGTAGLF